MNARNFLPPPHGPKAGKGEAHRPRPIGDGTYAIPLADPVAALQFCQALADAIGSGPKASMDLRSRAHMPEVSDATNPHPVLSIVIPVFNEAENIETLHSRLSAVLQDMDHEYEIIYVDDGSQDQSPALLNRLARGDGHVVVVELARNFGHQVAISAGLEHSRGRAVCIMDADLQDPPEVLPKFLEKWQEGAEVVYAIRTMRKEWWGKRLAYAGFYRLLQRVANIKMPLDAGDFCIMDRCVVDQLVQMPERNRFVRGIRSWIGFHQVGVAYERHSRHAGRPKYTFRKLVYLALDGLISFSHMPLRIITLLGIAVSLLSFTVALFYVVKKVALGAGIPGFTTLVVSIFFLAGIQLMTIGVIGEYIGRISDEVKRRPLYVARRVTRRDLPFAS